MAAPAIRCSVSASMSAASTTMGPREVLTNRAEGFIKANSAAADEPPGAGAQHQVNGNHVGQAQQLLFRYQPCPGCRGALRGEILTPGDDVHAERQADPRNVRAHVAQADDAECLAGHVIAHAALPAAGAQRGGLREEMARAAEDERPRQLDGGARGVARMNHRDAPLLGRGDVDRGVARPGRGDQFQPRQTLDHGARQGCPLPHDAHHLVRPQSFNHRIGVIQMIAKHIDARSRQYRRPVGELERDSLIVIEHRDRGFRCHGARAAARSRIGRASDVRLASSTSSRKAR